MTLWCTHTWSLSSRSTRTGHTRVDPRGYKSFGKRLSRKIVCGDCGRPFVHKTGSS